MSKLNTISNSILNLNVLASMSRSHLAIILSALLTMPLFVFYNATQIPAFYAQWGTLAIAALGMVSLLSKHAWLSINIPQIGFVFIGLAGITCIQWMLGMLHSKAYAILSLTLLLSAFVLTILGAIARQTVGWQALVKQLSWASLFSGVVLAAMLGYQSAALSQHAQAQSMLPHLSAYLGLAMVSLAYLYATQHIKAPIGAVLLLVLLSALAVITPMLGWFYVLLTAVLAVVQQIIAIKQANGSKQKRALVRAAFALIPMYGVLHLILSQLAQPQHATQHLAIWQSSWQLFSQSPWLGIGMGNVAWQSFLSIKTPAVDGVLGVYLSTQNFILQLMVELGVGALIILLVGLVAWAKAIAWKNLSLETWWLIASLGILLVLGMVESPFSAAYLLAIAAILLGAGDEKTSPINKPALSTVVSSTLLTVLVVGLFTTWIGHQKLTQAAQLAKHPLSAQQQQTLYNQIDWVHTKTVLAPYAEQTLAQSLDTNNENLDAKIWLTDSAMRFTPSTKLAYQHTMFLELKGDHQAAVRYLKYTLNADPIKLKQQLNLYPMTQWQHYLNILSGARPIKPKKQPPAPKPVQHTQIKPHSTQGQPT